MRNLDKVFDDMIERLSNIESGLSKNDEVQYTCLNKRGTDEFVLLMNIAGYDKNKVSVEVVNNKTIRVECDKVEDDFEGYEVVREYKYRYEGRAFEKAFNFVKDIVVNEAIVDNGILKIYFNYKQDQFDCNKINVKFGK